MGNENIMASLSGWMWLFGRGILILAIGIVIGLIWGISLDPTCTPAMHVPLN